MVVTLGTPLQYVFSSRPHLGVHICLQRSSYAALCGECDIVQTLLGGGAEPLLEYPAADSASDFARIPKRSGRIFFSENEK